MNLNEVSQFLKEKNEPRYIFNLIRQSYYRNSLDGWLNMTNLKKLLREELAQKIKYYSLTEKEIIQSKNNDAYKAVLECEDGKLIETVLMVFPDRITACISTQIGCAMGCKFCATGANGFTRDLKDYEIVEQIIYWNKRLKASDKKVSSVVFMGMGEPFLNWENVWSALQIIMVKDGLNIGQRHLSVSTVGIPNMIKKFMELNTQINLATSLNAVDQKKREKLMPISEKYELKELIETCFEYVEYTNRKLFFEYVLIKDINDSDEDMENLKVLIDSHKLFHLNLILCNEVGEKYQAPSKERVDAIVKYFKDNNVRFSIRKSFGRDIDAACGMLAGKQKKTKVINK